MAAPLELYRNPAAMEPLFPADPSGELEDLATKLIRTSAGLSTAMHPVTRAAVAELVRPMNSYYSNLIEGHDTHPIAIDKALRNELVKDKKQRDLQLEAVAHINLHRELYAVIEAQLATRLPLYEIEEVHTHFGMIVWHRGLYGDREDFADRLYQQYLRGGYPCGWDGRFPAGRLVVYYRR